MPDALTRSERLHPEARALLESMDAQGLAPLIASGQFQDAAACH